MPKIAAWQLALRFALEIASFIAIGVGARSLVSTGPTAWVLAFAAPTIAAIAWGTFAVKGDPSRSGNAPVEVPGWLRLVVELAVFTTGALSLALLHHWPSFALLVAGLIVHHVGTTARLTWLLRGARHPTTND